MIAEIVLMAALTVLPPLDTEPPGGVPDPGTAGGEVVEIPPEEGEIIVLPGDDLSSGDTSVDDNNNSVDGLGGVVDEPVPNSGNLPAFPASLDAAIQTFESLIFDNLSLLGLFVNVETLKVAVPLFVVIVNFDKLYRLTMWVIKKLPLGIK